MSETAPSPGEIDPDRVQKSLNYSIWDGIFYAVMTGSGESYLIAFAVFLAATDPQIALLSSLPQLVGALFQFASVSLLHFLHRRKPLILIGVIGQTAVWPIIATLSFIPDLSSKQQVLCLTGMVTLYFMFGSFANPPWSSLMGDLVDANKRGDYFGRRNRWISITHLGALALAGFVLHQAQQSGKVAAGFVVLFVAALISRLISASYLSRMIDPPYLRHDADHFSIGQFIRDGRKTNFGRFVTYTALTHFAVTVSGPFITPYLLRNLHFSYLQFMIATAAIVLSQFLTLHLWGKLGDHFGNKRTLTLTGLTLAIIPLLWVFATNLIWAVGIQLFAGVIWAGFTLSMGNFVFDAVSPPKRAQCVAIYNSANAIGIFFGSSLGGLLLIFLPETLALFGSSLLHFSNLQMLFVLSAALRLAIALRFLPSLKETRDVKPFIARDLYTLMSEGTPFIGKKSSEE